MSNTRTIKNPGKPDAQPNTLAGRQAMKDMLKEGVKTNVFYMATAIIACANM